MGSTRRNTAGSPAVLIKKRWPYAAAELSLVEVDASLVEEEVSFVEEGLSLAEELEVELEELSSFVSLGAFGLSPVPLLDPFFE